LTATPNESDDFITADELQQLRLPAPRWAVPGILPAGLSLLAGRPKTGKSWLAFNIALAVAGHGKALGAFEVEPGDTLVMALEDTRLRLQSRLTTMLGSDPWPRRLTVSTHCPRIDEGGPAKIGRWLDEHRSARLVVIDTLAKVRPRGRGTARLYDDDYSAIVPLKTLADDYSVAILVVHHVRKSAADDPLDLVSGTTGLTGAADGTLVLKRERSSTMLYLRGRDMPEADLSVAFDPARGFWQLLGDDAGLTKERADIIATLKKAGRPLTAPKVAAALGKRPEATRWLLWQMANDGQIRRVERGEYAALLV
jgi:hypothetical protein